MPRKSLHAELSPRIIDCTQPMGCDRFCKERCLWRWEHEIQPAAISYAKRHDLNTTKDHIRHCKSLSKSIGKMWGREKMIEHWKKVQANPRMPMAGEFATQALVALHAEREPGSDDE